MISQRRVFKIAKPLCDLAGPAGRGSSPARRASGFNSSTIGKAAHGPSRSAFEIVPTFVRIDVLSHKNGETFAGCAVMRKLIILANALLRKNLAWEPKAA